MSDESSSSHPDNLVRRQTIVYEKGYLLKRTKVLRKWKSRFFVLQQGVLKYYKKPMDSRKRGEIHVTGCNVSAMPYETYKKEFSFVVCSPTCSQIFVLQAQSKDMLMQWIQAIKQHSALMREIQSRQIYVRISDERTVKNYVEYKIEVKHEDLVWHVWKRFSDFRFLYDEIAETFTSDHLDTWVKGPPPKSFLPAKMKSKSRRKTQHTLRRNQLEEFIRNLCLAPKIRESVVLLTFLGVVRRCDFQSEGFKNPQFRQLIDLHKALKVLDIGDIILMRTSSVLSGLQRTFTQSDWDHVGMVIRLPMWAESQSSLTILEATNEGVKTTPLDIRLMDYQDSNVVVRKLRWKKTQEQLDNLEHFVNETNGKRYSLKSYFGRKKTSPDAFFCSELVATAYQRMGILKPEIFPSTVLPGHFSAESHLDLVNAELLSEIMMDWVQLDVANAREKGTKTELMRERSQTRLRHSSQYQYQSNSQTKSAHTNGTIVPKPNNSTPIRSLSWQHARSHSESEIEITEEKVSEHARRKSRPFGSRGKRPTPENLDCLPVRTNSAIIPCLDSDSSDSEDNIQIVNPLPYSFSDSDITSGIVISTDVASGNRHSLSGVDTCELSYSRRSSFPSRRNKRRLTIEESLTISLSM